VTGGTSVEGVADIELNRLATAFKSEPSEGGGAAGSGAMRFCVDDAAGGVTGVTKGSAFGSSATTAGADVISTGTVSAVSVPKSSASVLLASIKLSSEPAFVSEFSDAACIPSGSSPSIKSSAAFQGNRPDASISGCARVGTEGGAGGGGPPVILDESLLPSLSGSGAAAAAGSTGFKSVLLGTVRAEIDEIFGAIGSAGVDETGCFAGFISDFNDSVVFTGRADGAEPPAEVPSAGVFSDF
jgi:hypothetical protein